MHRRGRVSTIVAAVAAVGAVGVGTVTAASRSGDEAALEQQVQRGSSNNDRNIERRIDELMRKMSLDDKLQQLTLLSDGQMKDHPEEARKGVGGVFSETDPVLINK